MEKLYTIDFFNDLLFIMFIVGLVVFITLYFVDAGYGKMRTEKWGIGGYCSDSSDDTV